MTQKIQWAGVSGSLRADSYNTKLLKEILELIPEDVDMTILPIRDIPLYDADYDLPLASQRPAVVTAFRDELEKCQGIVIVSPEYNHSIPGGLKNALDWASRGTDSPLLRKPVALFGATTGMTGTARMQLSILPVFQFLDMQPVYQPEVLIAKAADKFDEKGKLTDEKAKEIIRKKLNKLHDLSLKYRTEK